jgi:DivIVA domain-containing protein
MNPQDVAHQDFATARRGYEPDAVRRFLERVATELASLNARLDAAEAARVAAEQRPAVAPELDQASLAAALGSETARVLQVAHEAARDVVARAEGQALAILAEVKSNAEEQRHVAEAEAFMASARARAEAEAMLQRAKDQCQAMIDEAREARRRILGDLAERRRLLHVQLEQLRAAKEALREVITGVGESVDQVRANLEDSDEHVRAVAEDAAQYALAEFESILPDELVQSAISTMALRAGSEARELDLFDTELVGSTLIEQASSQDTAPETSPPGTDEPSGVGATERDVATDGAPAEQGEPDRVLDVFRRLRESQTEPDGARELAEPAEPALVEDAPVTATSEASNVDEPQLEVEPLTADAEAGEGTVQDVPVEDDEDAPFFARRAALLDDHVGELSRSLKKVLRLEQNDLLDALRQMGRHDEPASLLPGEEMVSRVKSACLAPITAAYAAGRRFSADQLGLEASDGEVSTEADDIAAELAHEIVESILRRIEPLISASGDEDGVASAVSVAFRDWKGVRAETVATDYALRSFSLGVVSHARAKDAFVRWVVDDGESLCPECDDNSLAGLVSAHETFPTGHRHPPIHSGCRCLVIPSRS